MKKSTWTNKFYLSVKQTMKISLSWTAPIIRFIYEMWCRTLRYTETNRHFMDDPLASGTPVCLAFWHNELFPLIHLRKKQPTAAIVSQSEDGELLARVLEGMNIKTARGSSSRGGVRALVKAAQLMRKECCVVCISVDGPRGPRHEVKEGAIYLAKMTKGLIVPVRLFMSNYKAFGSWDRFQLPLPFSRVEVIFGEPFDPLEKGCTSDAELITYGVSTLKQRLEEIKPEKLKLKL